MLIVCGARRWLSTALRKKRPATSRFALSLKLTVLPARSTARYKWRHSPRILTQTSRRPGRLAEQTVASISLEVRCVVLHPAQNGHRHAALGNHLHQVSQAQLELKIPAHTQDNYFAVKVTRSNSPCTLFSLPTADPKPVQPRHPAGRQEQNRGVRKKERFGSEATRARADQMAGSKPSRSQKIIPAYRKEAAPDRLAEACVR